MQSGQDVLVPDNDDRRLGNSTVIAIARSAHASASAGARIASYTWRGNEAAIRNLAPPDASAEARREGLMKRERHCSEESAYEEGLGGCGATVHVLYSPITMALACTTAPAAIVRQRERQGC